MQAADGAEGLSEVQVHRRLSAALGPPVQVLGALAGCRTVDAACDGQGMAHPRLQNLLAVEVPCRDSDGIYGGGVRDFLDSCGIEEVRAAYRCPWQNPFVERFGGTLCRELLDHVIVLGQGHLERLLREFIEEYYNTTRPHQGLDGDTPIPQPKANAPITGRTKLISTPILGGLHHRYQRVAA
jgi:hypothetical protein